MDRIDSHQHFWKVNRGDYGWLTPEQGVLYKDYQPEDILPLLKASNIDKTIVVQAAETTAETEYLLALADENEFIVGVVGWVDMEDDVCLEDFAKHSKFKGIRPMIQDIPDTNWMLKDELGPTLRKIEELGLCFDALVKPPHLSALQKFVLRYPTLKIVIDHGAKPNIANGEFNHWANDIKKLSKSKNVYCKISGLLTEAKQGASQKDLKVYVDHLLECFGAERLMWGSDWPVLKLANEYENWMQMSEEMLSDLSEHDKAYIFGGTASIFYNL